MISVDNDAAPPLSWVDHDIEQKIGFSGGQYTQVNMLLTFLIALGATVIFYAILIGVCGTNWFVAMFVDRGITPYPIVFLGFWTTAILLIKWRKIRYQKRALNYSILPDDRTFILTPTSVDAVLDRICHIAEDPDRFLLYHRILLTLSNLRNIGRVSDVDQLLRSQSQQDENSVETGYTMLGGFLWAIPILGFIGTVLGLSNAIGHFGGILTADAQMDQLIPGLKQVTGGLATAFETTLIALVIALILQLFATSIRQSEEAFLDRCAEYCSTHIVSKLRIDYIDDNK